MARKYAALHLGNYTDKELSEAKSMSERIQSRLQLCPQQCVNSYFRPQQAMLWAKIVIYTLLWTKIAIHTTSCVISGFRAQ